VVNFFGSWCEPCREELPALEAASRRYGDRVAFIAIDLYEPPDRGAAMLRELGVTFAAGSDPKGEVATDYRLRGNPSTAFVTADGKLLELVPGALKPAEIERRIDGLLTLRTTRS
jgi:thiol-disulfide isomerase/thioredoxin